MENILKNIMYVIILFCREYWLVICTIIVYLLFTACTIRRHRRLLLLGTILLALGYGAHSGYLKQKWEELTMPACETAQFNWSVRVSSYDVDHGVSRIESMENNTWFKDAQGKWLRSWYGIGSPWGVGIEPMGGGKITSRLPKTFRLGYYDYLEQRFYQLDAELPLQELYQLFSSKTFDFEEGMVKPQYDQLRFGIAPNGYVMVWAAGVNGRYQVELASYRARVLEDMTVERYNREFKPGFPLKADRWQVLADGTSLEPATIEKLKQGWLPDESYYVQSRVKYPWRFQLSGEFHLTEINAWYGNSESKSTGAWEIDNYKRIPCLRGIPFEATLWFQGRGNRYRMHIDFSKGYRVAQEKDLSAVWAAFHYLFPGRTAADNKHWPGERDMATVQLDFNEDMSRVTATLVKGDQRQPLAIGKVDIVSGLKPLTFYLPQDPPDRKTIKLLTEGPPKHSWF